MLERLREDIEAVKERDPAARGSLEIALAYPGLHALWMHRLAHRLWELRVPLVPRLLAGFSRRRTGIEIHPGARLGRRLFIDHGMGIVIGETAEVGDDVTLYQGVTLGGTGKQRGKRHPTLEDGAVVGCGAAVLGPIAVGRGAKIGSGAVVTKPVLPGATVIGIPARPVMAEREVAAGNGECPDPVAEMLSCYNRRIDRLEKHKEDAESELAILRQRLEKAESRLAARMPLLLDSEVGGKSANR